MSYLTATRTAEQIELDMAAEAAEMKARWAREDACRASGAVCDSRREAQRLRDLARQYEALADSDPDAPRDRIESLRVQADVLDPPADHKVVRETLFMWCVTEYADGNSTYSTQMVAEPSRELVRDVWALTQAHEARRSSEMRPVPWRIGPTGQWTTRMQFMRRVVLSGLTRELSCEVFNSRGTPEGKVWAKALALFEKYRDEDS